MKGPAIDPSPHEDLPSDIAFRLWILSLTPEDVLKDRAAARGTNMERWVREARRRNVIRYTEQHLPERGNRR